MREDRLLTRAERLRRPLARDVLADLAATHGVCARPIAYRCLDPATGETRLVDLPCGSTLGSVCPACAERGRQLRIDQIRAGWHTDTEPVPESDPPTEAHKVLVERRAGLEEARATAADPAACAAVERDVEAWDDELVRSGVRGSISTRKRRARSTRHRADVPDLPRLPVAERTIGPTFPTRDRKVFRPSLFWTATLPSYGPVHGAGSKACRCGRAHSENDPLVPLDPHDYDYRRAARDALHVGELFDRTIQNLRRAVGWDIQHVACVEPQRRLAVHVHVLSRGVVPRAMLRQVCAATYHQVWWHSAERIVFDDDAPPEWDPELAGYFDPATGAPLPTWEEALDTLDQALDGDPARVEPHHVIRWGPQVNAQGIIAGSTLADRAIGYTTKYLTKQIAEVYRPGGDEAIAHRNRLVEALRHEPCSPRCANWLRYGVQPANVQAGLRPGRCRGKAHRAERLGYAGRLVLVSRKWSGKTLTDHRRDRAAWVAQQLGHAIDASGGNSATNQGTSHGSLIWERARPDDPDVPPFSIRILRALARRIRWRSELTASTRRADAPVAAGTRRDQVLISPSSPSWPLWSWSATGQGSREA